MYSRYFQDEEQGTSSQTNEAQLALHAIFWAILQIQLETHLKGA